MVKKRKMEKLFNVKCDRENKWLFDVEKIVKGIEKELDFEYLPRYFATMARILCRFISIWIT